MDTRPDAVYNLTRRTLLNDKLTVTDCAHQPLKMLNLVVSGLGLDSESALWLSPLHSAPGLPRVFPFDLIYLDRDHRVLEIAEIAPGVEFPAYRPGVASALVIPQHTLTSTGTSKGDRLIICPANELQILLAKAGMPVRAEILSKIEKPATASLFPRRAASPGERNAPIARNEITDSAPPVSTLPAQAHEPVSPVREFVRDSEASAPVAKESGKSAEIRRLLFEERVSQPEPPQQSQVPAPSQTSGPDTNSPRPAAAQKTDRRESPPQTPQKFAATRPSRSTTSFATSSLPMWHVSAPTAIPPVSRSTQGLGTTTSQAGANPQPVSQPKTSEVAPVPADSSSARIASPAAFEDAGQSSPTPPNHIAPKRPVPDDARKMWPKIAPATATFVAGENRISADAESPVPENGDFAWQPAPATPAAKTNGSAPAQPAGPNHPARVAASAPQSEQKSSLKRWTLSAEINGKNDIRSSLRSRIKQWLNPVTTPGNRRRAERRYVPGMIAHYFNGGAPKPHAVADISMTGFYLLTDERWMTGTMIQMTMQKPSKRGGKQSITVLSRIVRRGSDGVGAEFVMPESIDSHSHDIQPSQATDRLTLARFL